MSSAASVSGDERLRLFVAPFREDGEPEHPIPVRLLTELLLAGSLPGLSERAVRWEPAMGLRDFRLWDTF